MNVILSVSAVAACSAVAMGSIQVTSYTSSWSAQATMLRAITLGGGSDQLGERGELLLGDFSRAIADSGFVGRDYAYLDAHLNTSTSAERLQWQYNYTTSGAMEHPSAADNGQMRMDFSSTVRMMFTVTEPQQLYMQGEMIGDLREMWIETADHTSGFGLAGGNGATSGVLEPGEYIFGVVYGGYSLFNTSAHPPGQLSSFDYSGVCNFTLVFPSPGTVPLGIAGVLFILPRRRKCVVSAAH